MVTSYLQADTRLCPTPSAALSVQHYKLTPSKSLHQAALRVTHTVGLIKLDGNLPFPKILYRHTSELQTRAVLTCNNIFP